MVGIRGMRNYPSYHLDLRARLLICPTKVGNQHELWGLLAKWEQFTGENMIKGVIRRMRGWNQDMGRDIEGPGDESRNFKIKCVGEVPYPYVGREGIWFIPHDIPTHIWLKES